jgi:hypothetical protein
VPLAAAAVRTAHARWGEREEGMKTKRPTPEAYPMRNGISYFIGELTLAPSPLAREHAHTHTLGAECRRVPLTATTDRSGRRPGAA